MLDWQWTTGSLRPFVSQTLEIFGPGRCLFASNFPVDRLFGAFARHFSARQSLTATLSPAERAQVFATNAERIYRI
jgi:predicted TIM-barrel fold metal-dependent hydrolase